MNGDVRVYALIEADGTEEETTLKDFTDNFQSIVIRQAMAGFDTEGIDIKDILGGNA